MASRSPATLTVSSADLITTFLLSRDRPTCNWTLSAELPLPDRIPQSALSVQTPRSSCSTDNNAIPSLLITADNGDTQPSERWGPPMRCSKCGTESTSGRKFCAECGSPFANLCAKCGAESSPTAKFCEDCGAPLGAPASSKKSNDTPIRVADAPASENLEGERKTVTALFADIKGSTELEQDLDPEEARAIVDPALKLMIDAVRRYDGYVVQSTGDGIFAIFGAPVAHEDHPQRALYAALRMQEELKRYSAKLVADGGMPIEARVGVNTGEVVVRSISTGGGHTEYTPIGHTTNLASRS